MSVPNPLPVASYTQLDYFEPIDKDPINLVYVGALANLERVRSVSMGTLGLRTDKGVGSQVFCEPQRPHVRHRQDFNLADRPWSGIAGRFHTRIYQLFTSHPQLEAIVASPIHEESWAICRPILNDSVRERGFDSARDWAVRRLVRQGFEVIFMPLARYGPVVQCDGRSVDTDGLCAVIADPTFLGQQGFQPKFSARLGLIPPP